jgi:hypothetical protein
LHVARYAAPVRPVTGGPGHRSQTRGAVLREAAALPRLSACGSRPRRCRRENRDCFARRAAVELLLPLRRQSRCLRAGRQGPSWLP